MFERTPLPFCRAAQAVKVVIPLGVLLSYGLQLYVVPVTLWSGLHHRVPDTRKDAAYNLLRAGAVLFTGEKLCFF